MKEPPGFLAACRRQPVRCTPIWIMRQAGRYLPEYRAIRSRIPFLDLCKDPALAAEVTLQPVRLLGVDAAILFSDILIPLEAMGVRLRFTPAPLLENPVRDRKEIEALRIPDPVGDLSFVLDTIRILRRELGGTPLIGFCGAPFTLACYLTEGKGSRDFATVKKMMFSEPELFRALMEKLTAMSIAYLRAQIEAGVQAVQIFDTWAGILAPADYGEFVLPHLRALIRGLDRGATPVILFIKGVGGLLELIRDCGADVLALDWMVSLERARRLLGTEIAVQGNLDPALLLTPKPRIEAAVQRILEENGGRPGHIFNLGHGILPATPVDHVRFLVETVHRLSAAEIAWPLTKGKE
ncbi:MAG: uroporphyrinogen decarboxylase [Deltaproteobacteria bacterium]|nr:uroporphyrinogen decarboxylase [Deltaproteobacteria bacterium]